MKKNDKGDVEGAILVHVDDIQLAATPPEGQRLKAKLEARFSLTTQGPCGPNGELPHIVFELQPVSFPTSERVYQFVYFSVGEDNKDHIRKLSTSAGDGDVSQHGDGVQTLYLLAFPS